MNPLKLTALAALLALGTASHTAQARDTRCHMTFSLSGWSLFYKTARGSGTVRCENGQTMNVRLRAKGGGLTVGKTSVKNGIGVFTGVNNISDVLGHYGTAEAHAGAEKSASAQALTKGDVSLALSGKGKGWNLGVAFGAFIIER